MDMAYLLDLKKYTDERGNLVVVDNVLPFEMKRIFYIYGVDHSIRGGHRHKETIQAAICLKGSCCIENDDGEIRQSFNLNRPDLCLVLLPTDWHQMHSFSEDAMLMVLASKGYDPEDYIYEKYDDRV